MSGSVTIEKLRQATSLEEIDAVIKAARSRKKELKNVGNVENQAILRGLAAKVGGWDGLKHDLAVVRKEFKDAAKAKEEAELAGLEEETEEEEEEQEAA